MMRDVAQTRSITFTSNPSRLASKTPLSGEGSPPLELRSGQQVSVPITVTNRSEAEMSGIVWLTATNAEGQEVYCIELAVTVAPGSRQELALPLRITGDAGWDIVRSAVISDGSEAAIFSEYISLKQETIYLPLVLRSQ